MDTSCSWAISEKGPPKRSHTVVQARPATASSLLRGGRIEHGGPWLPANGVRWGGHYLQHEVSRKCEALAVTGLASFGDFLEIIAPIEIIKDLFKLPYNQSPISISIHRVGSTLVLSAGSDLEDNPEPPASEVTKEIQSAEVARLLGHKVASSRSSAHPSLNKLLGFDNQDGGNKMPDTEDLVFGSFSARTSEVLSGARPHQADGMSFKGSKTAADNDKGFRSEILERRQDRHGEVPRPSNRQATSHDQLKLEDSQARARSEVDSNEDNKRGNSSGSSGRTHDEDTGDYPFARVVIWHFDIWRMLLGSDLAIFSNKEHSAVSLHLVDIHLESSPLLWLDIWLENVMAGIPEVAICYHHKDVIHGYELLRTDDISQIKALNRDGSPSFHPAVVEHCAATALDFIRKNCSRSPGTYLLKKEQGHGPLQLHDYTDVKAGKAATCNPTSAVTIRPTSRSRTLPLAMLVYRLAKRLQTLQRSGDVHRSAQLFHQALRFLDEEDHPGICSSAHEYIAEHCLKYGCSLNSAVPLLLEGPPEEDESNLYRSGPPGSDVPQSESQDSLLLRKEEEPHSSNHHTTASLLLPPAIQGHQTPYVELLEDDQGAKSSRANAIEPASLTHGGQESGRKSECLRETLSSGNMSASPHGSPSKQSIAPAGNFLEHLKGMRLEEKTRHASLSAHHMSVHPDRVVDVSGSHLARSCGSHESDVAEEGVGDTGTQVGLRKEACIEETALDCEREVASCLCAVEHAAKAVTALRSKRKISSATQTATLQLDDPVFPDQDIISMVARSSAVEQCICGETDCFGDEEKALPSNVRVSSLPDRKRVCSLIHLLAEAYLKLAEAYKAEGKVSRALHAAEIACLVLGGVPLAQSNRADIAPESVASGGSAKERRRKGKKKKDAQKLSTDVIGREPPAGGRGDRMERAYRIRSRNAKSFLGQAWALAGEMFVELAKDTAGQFHNDSAVSKQGRQDNSGWKAVDSVQGREGGSRSAPASRDDTSQRQGSSENEEVRRLAEWGNMERLQVVPEVLAEVTQMKGQREYWIGDGVLIEGDMDDEPVCYVCHSARCSCLDDAAVPEMAPCTTSTSDPWIVSQGVSSGRVPVARPNAIHELGMNTSMGPNGHKVLTTGQEENAEFPQNHAGQATFTKASCFGQPLDSDFSSMISAAAILFSRAATAFEASREEAEKSDTLRKEAWCHNELGRHELQSNPEKAAASFSQAANAFRQAGDVCNTVYSLCNLAHGERARAELLLASISDGAGCATDVTLQTVLHTRKCYASALGWYSQARKELLKLGERAPKDFAGAWHDTHKQLANTYLRLGLFLQRFQSALESDRGVGEMLCTEAFTKAIVLFESRGSSCKQEAAYAYHLLAACHGQEAVHSSHKGAKDLAQRQVSLAEANWQKALDVYKGDAYFDIYVTIMSQRARLIHEVHGAASFQEVGAALGYLTEVKDRATANNPAGQHLHTSAHSESLVPLLSTNTSASFVKTLQSVIKDGLSLSLRQRAVQESHTRSSSGGGASQGFRGIPSSAWKLAYSRALEMNGFDPATLLAVWKCFECER